MKSSSDSNPVIAAVQIEAQRLHPPPPTSVLPSVSPALISLNKGPPNITPMATPTTSMPNGPSPSAGATSAVAPLTKQPTPHVPLSSGIKVEQPYSAMDPSQTALPPRPSPPKSNNDTPRAGPSSAQPVNPGSQPASPAQKAFAARAPANPSGGGSPPNPAPPPASATMKQLPTTFNAAQAIGLTHLHNIGPGTSYSSPPQAFRPPTHTSAQPFRATPQPQPQLQPQSQAKFQDHARQNTPTPPQTQASRPMNEKPGESRPGSRSNTVDSAASPAVASAPSVNTSTSTTILSSSTAAPSDNKGNEDADTGTSTSKSNASPFAASDVARATPTNKNNPAFLNKLRSMVDDPKTDELIRWSPDGASFFVPNHVRFGDEVLPRFFKHNRFSSFVRQLNMYGFHKVPHLQQGALKHDLPTENELWEFTNPNFHRDKPELLAKVQRKRGVKDSSEAHEGAGNEISPPNALMRGDQGIGFSGDQNQSGGLQLSSVLSAIHAIKNAQSSISADLRHLQNSNQGLWQEAIESRQRSKRQQETINKILRFLAGVFGTQEAGEGASGSEGTLPPRGGRRVTVRPAKPGRLMIEGGESSRKSGDDVEHLELPMDEEEVEELPSHLRFSEAGTNDSSPRLNSASRFTALNSPPKSGDDLAEFSTEAMSTPGGSRKLSSQASSQVLNALASGEGGAWLASLFGNASSSPGQGTNSSGSISGGGFKLDSSMVAALQNALASANSGNEAQNSAGPSTFNNAEYFAGRSLDSDKDEVSRFTYPVSSASEFAPSLSTPSKNASSYSSANSAFASLDPEELARFAGLSQALIPSPSRPSQHAISMPPGSSTPADFSGAGSSALFSPGLSQVSSIPGNSAPQSVNEGQVALSLARATRELQGTASDVNSVQNSINALIESLKIDPNSLNALCATNQSHQAPQSSQPQPTSQTQPPFLPQRQPSKPQQHKSQVTASLDTLQANSPHSTSSNAQLNNAMASGSGMSDESHASWSTSSPSGISSSGNMTPYSGNLNSTGTLQMPSTSEAPSSFAGAGVVNEMGDSSMDTNVSGMTGLELDGTNGNPSFDAEFDVDSFLNQFVNTPTGVAGASPGVGFDAPSPVSNHRHGIFSDSLNELDSPAFAFSPNSSRAFIQSELQTAPPQPLPIATIKAGEGQDSRSNSDSSSTASTPVVGSWGIENPGASNLVGSASGSRSGSVGTPLTLATPTSGSLNNSPIIPKTSLRGNSPSTAGSGSAVKKRKTAFEGALGPDIEAANAKAKKLQRTSPERAL